MRRLLRHDFEPDPAVEGKRRQLLERGDELFDAVMCSAGGMKRHAIQVFDRHNEGVKRLLAEHYSYFIRKRFHLLETMTLNHGLQGGSPVGLCGRRTGRPNARTVFLTLTVLWPLVGCGGSAMAMVDSHKAVLAVIGEAEGEGYEGMLAVAGAIRNRGTLKGVYGLRAPRVLLHRYSAKTYRLAVRAWRESAANDITRGATGWGNAKDMEIFRHSAWFPSLYLTAHIGSHYFYGTDG